MFEAKVFLVSIPSAGIVLEEEHIAREVIARWNVEEGVKRGVAFLTIPSNYVDITPDIFIFVIDNYVDELRVDAAIATDAKVLLFFRSNHDEKNTMESEVKAIDVFRGKLQSKSVSIDYCNNHEFTQCLFAKLTIINNMI